MANELFQLPSVMYNDNILYCDDLPALKAKLLADGFYDAESKSYSVPHSITPIHYDDKGIKSITLVRDNVLPLEEYPMLINLGTYAEIFADPTKDALYQSVWDYTSVLSYTDDEGNTTRYNRPKRIGVFA